MDLILMGALGLLEYEEVTPAVTVEFNRTASMFVDAGAVPIFVGLMADVQRLPDGEMGLRLVAKLASLLSLIGGVVAEEDGLAAPLSASPPALRGLLKVIVCREIPVDYRDDAGILLLMASKTALLAVDAGPVVVSLLQRGLRAFERAARGQAPSPQGLDDQRACRRAIKLARRLLDVLPEGLAGVHPDEMAARGLRLIPMTATAPVEPFLPPLVALLGLVDGDAFSDAALALVFAVQGAHCAQAIEAGALRHLASALDPAARREMPADGAQAACILVAALAEAAPPSYVPHFRAAGLFPLVEAAVGRAGIAAHVLETLRTLERSGGVPMGPGNVPGYGRMFVSM